MELVDCQHLRCLSNEYDDDDDITFSTYCDQK